MSLQRTLAIVLGVQLLLVAVFWWPRDPAAGIRPVFDVGRADIERVEIETRPAAGAEPSPLVLVRDDDRWKLASAADYPADPEKVEQLIDSLVALHAGSAIATRAASHSALNVADDNYGRRIRVAAGGETSEWLMGAATSRSVNLRRADGDDVHLATGAGEWSFRDDARSYYDLTFIDADVETFGAVAVHNEHGELRFEKQEGGWRLADATDDETSVPEIIGDFLGEVARVRMTAPESASPEPAHGLEDGVRVDWTIIAEDQSVAGGYVVGSERDGERFVKGVGRPYVVRVSEDALDRLRNAQRADFLQ